MTTTDPTSGADRLLLVRTLERRSTRGTPHPAADVIAIARTGTYVAAAPAGDRRRRAALAAAAALIVASGLGGVLAVRHHHTSSSLLDGQDIERPLPLTPAERESAIATCGIGFAAIAPTNIVVDRRPGGTLVGAEGGGNMTLCPPGGIRVVGSGDLPRPAAPTRPLELRANSLDSTGEPAAGSALVWGRVSDEVATVLVSVNDTVYEATVEQGLFAASWPSGTDEHGWVRAYDAAGTEIDRIDPLG